MYIRHAILCTCKIETRLSNTIVLAFLTRVHSRWSDGSILYGEKFNKKYSFESRISDKNVVHKSIYRTGGQLVSVAVQII